MRVLLAHSYFLRFDEKARRQGMPYPPLGTLYAAAAAREAGNDVALFDAMLAASPAEISSALRGHAPDVAVFFEDNFNYLSKMCLSRMREACIEMIGLARRSGARVVVQGSDPVDHLAAYLDAGAEAVICGEGELTLTELLGAFRDAKPFNNISGLAFRDPAGAIVRTPKRALMRELDSLPHPAWDLLELAPYRAAWRRHGSFSMNLVTTRGCPFSCNWCSKPVYGQVYTSHSPARVAEEVRMLRDDYGARHIWFADDIFGLKPGWAEAFSTEIARLGARLPFKIQSRADLLCDGDTVRHLAEAGCTEVWIGAESGSQNILDAMEKGITIDQIRRSRRLLADHGIRACFFLQFGYPGETLADVNATIAMVRELRPDDIGISVSYPLPGTKFYDNVARSMGEKKNWETSGDLDHLFPGLYPPSFYRELHGFVHKDFRLRQGLRATSLRAGLLVPYYAMNRFLHSRRMNRLAASTSGSDA